jgi:hypothetical protein
MSYRAALEWIALNDDAATDDVSPNAQSTVESYITVKMVADLFGKSAEDVAARVLRRRRAERRARAREQRDPLVRRGKGAS